MLYWFSQLVGVDDGEVPPVPIPNTEVKLTCAEDSSLETAREIGSRRLEQKRFRRNSEAFFFCRKALSNLFLRVYTGMLVSKNIRVPAASRFLRLPPHHVFWQKSPYSLPLHLVHLRPPASQFQRRTQHCCHCIDNNTENLPPMHSQLFSTPADQQHSPAWKKTAVPNPSSPTVTSVGQKLVTF